MKKITAILMAVTLMLSLCVCGTLSGCSVNEEAEPKEGILLGEKRNPDVATITDSTVYSFETLKAETGFSFDNIDLDSIFNNFKEKTTSQYYEIYTDNNSGKKLACVYMFRDTNPECLFITATAADGISSEDFVKALGYGNANYSEFVSGNITVGLWHYAEHGYYECYIEEASWVENGVRYSIYQFFNLDII